MKKTTPDAGTSARTDQQFLIFQQPFAQQQLTAKTQQDHSLFGRI
ncbi:MAG: hypothetical protein Q7T80_13285 [Methanoregula sp.]|nr:hypothetical protein [Methanoregula sp.]